MVNRIGPVTPALLKLFIARATDTQLQSIVSFLNTCHWMATAECIDDTEEYLAEFADTWDAFKKDVRATGIDIPDKDADDDEYED